MFETLNKGEYKKFYEMWDEMEVIKRNKAIVGFIWCTLIIFFSYLYVFAFCTVYKESEYNVILGFFTSMAVDALLFEVFVEICVIICLSLDLE